MGGLEIVLFAGGVIAGLLAGFFLLPGMRQARRLAAELEELKKQHADYKDDVSRHFHKTADLVGVMTSSYKAVYDHLAEGARSLCEPPPGERRVPFASPKLIEVYAEQADESVPAGPNGAAPAETAAAPDAVTPPEPAEPSAEASRPAAEALR